MNGRELFDIEDPENHGGQSQYRELKREAVRAVRTDKEAQARGVCDTVESNLWSNVSRPVCRGIRTLRSSRPWPRCTTLKPVDGTAMTVVSEIRARWAGYFEELYLTDPTPSDREIQGDVDAVRVRTSCEL